MPRPHHILTVIACAALLALTPAWTGCKPRYFRGNTTPGLKNSQPATPLPASTQAANPKPDSPPTPVPNVSPNPPTLAPSTEDAEFLSRAVQLGELLVRIGQLLVKSSEQEPLERFGQRLVIEHSQASQAAADLAETTGINLPDNIIAPEEPKLSRLGRLYGVELGKAALNEVVRAHRDTISAYATAAARSQNPKVRELAQQTLPMLQQNLEEAKRLTTAH